MTTYIHYGNREFNKELFQPIKNRQCFTKPFGGFWASDVNAKFGWQQWNKENEFTSCQEENSFCFTLKENAKVIHLYKVEDLKQLPIVKNDLGFSLSSWYCIDFEELAESGVDAMEVHMSEGDHELYFPLYGWDCDSILIMNPDIIENMENKNDNCRD